MYPLERMAATGSIAARPPAGAAVVSAFAVRSCAPPRAVGLWHHTQPLFRSVARRKQDAGSEGFKRPGAVPRDRLADVTRLVLDLGRRLDLRRCRRSPTHVFGMVIGE
jgi:hypothetical protein